MHAFDPSAIIGKTRGSFDNVDYVDGLPGLVEHPQPTVVPHGASLLVSGWTVDPVTNGPPLAVCVLLDRARPLEARIGIARGDIMLKHGTDEFVGYQLVVSTSDLGSGAHELRTYALSSDGCWYESGLAGFRLFHHHRVLQAKRTLPRGLRVFLETPRDLATGLRIPLGTPIYANRSILFRGWAFDDELGIGAETMVARHEDGRSWSGPANIEDALAREALGADDERLGFEIAIPAAVFGRGRHRLQLTGLDASGRPYANSVDAEFDVISAERPFPLTARIAPSTPPFAARMRIVGDARDVDDKGPTRFLATLPSEAPIVVSPRDRLVIEGWALDESGVAADEVYLELTAAWIDLPPRRHPALCARGTAVDDMPGAPVDNAWFRVTFDFPALPSARYALALVIVQPARRSYSRASLAILKAG